MTQNLHWNLFQFQSQVSGVTCLFWPRHQALTLKLIKHLGTFGLKRCHYFPDR